jgi:hypothetical protein
LSDELVFTFAARPLHHDPGTSQTENANVLASIANRLSIHDRLLTPLRPSKPALTRQKTNDFDEVAVEEARASLVSVLSSEYGWKTMADLSTAVVQGQSVGVFGMRKKSQP